MTLEELEARVQNLEDVEAIKKLQIAYSHYLEHWEEEQLIGLFSNSPDVSVSAGTGDIVYKGPEGIKKFYHFAYHYPTLQTATPPPGFRFRVLSTLIRMVKQRKEDGLLSVFMLVIRQEKLMQNLGAGHLKMNM
jgi:hypothetical protein